MPLKQKVESLTTRAKGASTAAGRRAEELLALIARRKARITEDFYEIGAALREIERKKLYAALGFRSFAALLDKRSVMSERTARKLIEIAEAVPRARALELGSEKAYALARLAAATPEVDSVESVIAGGVRVGGKKRSVAKLSAKKLEDLARKIRPKKPPSDAEKEARAIARRVQAASRARGARRAAASAVRRAGRWWVRVEIPASEAELLARARSR